MKLNDVTKAAHVIRQAIYTTIVDNNYNGETNISLAVSHHCISSSRLRRDGDSYWIEYYDADLGDIGELLRQIKCIYSRNSTEPVVRTSAELQEFEYVMQEVINTRR